MIEVVCPRCQSRMEAPDEYAGLTVQCGNCEAPLVVPGPVAPAPAAAVASAAVPATAPTGQAGPTQIIVNVAGAAPQSEMVHKQANMFVAWLLLVFLNGAQYMYMGQIGKGVLVLVLDWCLVVLVCVTCGLGLAIYVPWRMLCLIDTLVVCSRLKKGPIHPWRCF
jgi:hypothetical protein